MPDNLQRISRKALRHLVIEKMNNEFLDEAEPFSNLGRFRWTAKNGNSN
jgi:hypothetical protein